MRTEGLVLVALCLAPYACAAPTLLPPLQPQSAGNVEILRNSGFEDGDKDWILWDWPPREKTDDRPIARSIFYSHDVVHTGRQALCFDLSTIGPERQLGIRQIISRAQLQPYEGRSMRLSAWLWVARGPAYYAADSNLRLWGDESTPLVAAPGFRLGGSPGQWQRGAVEFTLRLGSTRKADANVYLPNVPEVAKAPLVFVDDVSLEVFADLPLGSELLSGLVVGEPDDRLPVRVTVAPGTWERGLRGLRWDVTSKDGLRSYASGTSALTDRVSVIEAKLPPLAEGEFAVRLALGRTAADRTYEVLLPFRRTAGPFARQMAPQ